MSLRKRLLIILLPAAVILMLGLLSISIYGWYVNTKRIGTIDAETKDVAFTYTLNNGEDNATAYSVTNLSFFDIDDSDEVSYLSSMCVRVKISLTNTTKYSMAYKLSYESTHILKSAQAVAYASGVTYYSDEDCTTEVTGLTSSSDVTSYYVKKSEAYCEGTFSTASSLSVSDSLTDIESMTLIHEYGSVADGSTYTLDQNEEAVIYLYLYGVQLVDSAVNGDFITDSYKFVLTIEAQNMNDPEVTEVTSATVTE